MAVQQQWQPPAYLVIRGTGDIANNGIKVMVYGLAGAGKTRLLGTAPGVLILSAENGLLSLKVHNLPFIEVKTIQDLQYVYHQILTNPQWAWVQTVALDSISEIAETLLQALMASNANKQRAYGEMAQEVLNQLRTFRDIPGRNVVFIAKQGRVKDEQTGGMLYGPLMPGQQLDQHMPYMFDEVFQLCTFTGQDGKPYGALRTRRDNQNEAKDRSGLLDEWERPDLTAIFNKIKGTI